MVAQLDVTSVRTPSKERGMKQMRPSEVTVGGCAFWMGRVGVNEELMSLSCKVISSEGGRRGRRGRKEENNENSFLRLEAEELISDRWKADLSVDTIEVKSERRWWE